MSATEDPVTLYPSVGPDGKSLLVYAHDLVTPIPPKGMAIVFEDETPGGQRVLPGYYQDLLRKGLLQTKNPRQEVGEAHPALEFAFTAEEQELVDAKRTTMELGESAGEEHARALLKSHGIDALARTLKPSRHEPYAKAFYELWDGGQESWRSHARERNLASAKGAHPYYFKAFDWMFALGARRWAEMLVRGYLDARAGVPFSVPPGVTVPELKQQLALRERRVALGARRVDAYDAGHQLFTQQKDVNHG